MSTTPSSSLLDDARLELVPVTLTEAHEFVAQLHRHHSPSRGGRFAIGAAVSGEVVGVVVVGRPVAHELQDGWTAEGARPRHVCQPPTIVGLTVPQQPDWTCAKCGRIWRDCRSGTGVQWWAEVRGPTHHPRGETL